MPTEITTQSQVTFRAGSLAPALASRSDGGAPGLVAKRDLERYYAALADALPRAALTDAEWGLIADAVNGWAWDESRAPFLWAQLDDACRQSGLAEKWQVDGSALVERARAWPLAVSIAVLDAADQFWRGGTS